MCREAARLTSSFRVRELRVSQSCKRRQHISTLRLPAFSRSRLVCQCPAPARPLLRILDRERVNSVEIAEFAGFRHFDLRNLPGYVCVRTEQRRPGFPDRLLIRSHRCVRREQYGVIRIEGDGPRDIIFRGCSGPLFIKSLDRGCIGRAAVTSCRRSAGRDQEYRRDQ